MPHTNSRSTLQTLGNCMEKQLSILFVIWKRLVTLEPVFNLIVQKLLNAIATPTSPELGTSNSLIATQAQQNLEAVGLSSMQTVQSFGHQSCRPRLLFPQPNLNISPCLNPCKMSFPSCFLFKRWRTKVFKIFALSPICYHHFCEHVRNGLIKIFPISTKDQTANTLTKALAQNDFQHHRCHMCGLWPCQSCHCEGVWQ